jgi:hypothetical protein
VNAHIADCPAWAALYAVSPDKALDAESEFRRWKEQDKDDERTERREAVTEQGELARIASLQRFQYRDILEDDD